MHKTIYGLIIGISILLFSNCKRNEDYKNNLNDAALYRATVKKLSDVIVYDIFSPPVASRVYVYPNIAAYSIMQKGNTKKYTSLENQLKQFPTIANPKDTTNLNFNLAAIHAFLKIGQQLIFSEDRIVAYRDSIYGALKNNGLPDVIFEKSTKYGDKVANQILDWAKNDLYNQTRSYPKYTVLEEDKYWKPTPPDYMDGIEPHWNKIRTMVLDSSNQFSPKEPLEFSLEDGSDFKKQLLQVYKEGAGDSQEKKDIASFWDCNPYVSHHMGHAMFATKKITPGGHWIGITNIATEKSNSNFNETINAYTRVSISLFDAFISCWDEKWRSLVVRPETLINQFIDEEWVPLLQTPPFPEYTSGHSVISRAAAITLTDLYGPEFSFDDTTELEYGLPVRSFSSFLEASEEAAISRLYGGIHYMMAIEEGVKQGELVGLNQTKNLVTKL